jgi:integrase
MEPEYNPDASAAQEESGQIGLSAPVAGSGALDRLVETARDYARAAVSENTLKAYAKDWAHFARWCRMRGADPLPSSPPLIGLYIADLAAPGGKAPSQSASRPQSALRPLSVSSIERRLSGLTWGYAQRGERLDRKDRHIATVLAGIRRKHARPPLQKEAILPEDIRDMLATLPHDLRGLRDRAILLIGFAGGLRRSEIVSLDYGKDDTPDSGGWVRVLNEGALITLRGKTGWREVEIGRGSSDQTCPVHALSQWLHYARIDFGPIFVAVSRNGLKATDERLSDKHVARLIKQTVRDAGLRPDLPEAERIRLFSGHSLRAGLASSAEVDERYVQKQLGHASAEMTRRYQRRRDRFRVNLTKAAGL